MNDEVLGLAPGQDLADPFAGEPGHAGSGRAGGTSYVGEENCPRGAQERLGEWSARPRRRPARRRRSCRPESGFSEGGLVDDGTPRGVDEHSVGAQQLELSAADQVAGICGERNVEAQDVRGRHQVVEIGDVSGEPRCGRREWWSTVHPESGRPSCDGLPDPTESDESEHGTVDVTAEVLVDPPSVPASGAQIVSCLGAETRGGKHEQEGEVGGGLV